MSTWCPPPVNINPLPCGTDGGSPGPIEVAGCCSPSIATTTLCTSECTPVSLVIRSGCAECGDDAGDPQVLGWIDGDGLYTAGAPPAGLVPCDTCGGDAAPCDPLPRCPGLVGLSDGETWAPPDGTESVTISVVCPPVVIHPCTGDPAVTVNECGSVSYAAPGEPCTPGELCPNFTVDVPDGSAAYIAYVTTNCEGSTSP